ncbi:MAG: hypothetical protein AB2L09_07775 [Coriobacteriia bacterium]
MNNMNYGGIVKKAWNLTWRYRALWVLGLFAGVAGGSFNGGGSNLSSSTSSSSTTDLPSWASYSNLVALVDRILPILVAVFVVLVLFSLLWWVVGIAARGGLVYAVNEIEEGRPIRLRDAWNAGFDKFWRLLGLSILLNLPIVVLGLALAAAILVPVFAPIVRGGEPSGAVFAPICGALVIGVPLLIVLGVVLGLMYLVALRFIMLYNMPVFQAAGEAWRAFRGRLKNHLLMWLINLGLNFAAGIALAIPLGILGVAIIIPAVFAADAQRWSQFVGLMVVLGIVFFVLSLLFTAIWGTFTSALWTIFFRRLVGLEVEAPAYAAPQWTGQVPSSGIGQVPPPPPGYMNPMAPPAPSAPPMASPTQPSPPAPPAPPAPPVPPNPPEE